MLILSGNVEQESGVTTTCHIISEFSNNTLGGVARIVVKGFVSEAALLAGKPFVSEDWFDCYGADLSTALRSNNVVMAFYEFVKSKPKYSGCTITGEI